MTRERAPPPRPRGRTRPERKLAHAMAARDAAEARIAEIRRLLEARLPETPATGPDVLR